MNVKPFFYSIGETARILKISEEMVCILLSSGKIKGVKINGIWKIAKSSFQKTHLEYNK
ncbi:MAG: helix-turn-helix domain-containing protein [Desulfitobacteriaceae bacterium]|nr:helix-turn-helix domain-containing protein [Desulfitobacteriaceae bacterium]